MPKIKMPKSSPSIDMTPMVDLGFLLVTFFMLTTQFRPEEVATATTPSSISELILPDKNMMVLTIDKQNRVFYFFDGQKDRREVLMKMSAEYEVPFTEDQIKKFENISAVGVDIGILPKWLDAEGTERKQIIDQNAGVPMDSVNNQLKDWLYFSRMQPRNTNRETAYRVAIKGDREASYKTVKRVMKVLEEVKVFKFNLITEMKTE
jgi:biopolymer transport protein ExbD